MIIAIGIGEADGLHMNVAGIHDLAAGARLGDRGRGGGGIRTARQADDVNVIDPRRFICRRALIHA